jgi:hypothetical protein
MRPGDTASDPGFARTFFSADAARSLVRESIQNSLDARDPSKSSITVRFTLRSGGNGALPSAATPFFDGLWEHIHSKDTGLDKPPTIGEKIAYLVVEDFGTRGLTGSPEAWSPFESKQNAFYLFFRALGRSGKENEERGRWGVGKFVFPLASRAHSLLGYTVPTDSGVPILMGRAVLKVHQTNGVAFHPDGHWGQRKTEHGLVIPERDARLLKQFREVFNLHRSDEPGLSVVVPWLSLALNGSSITEAVVAEYFLPILRAELTIEIDDNGIVKTIDAATIVKVAESISSPELRARIDLAVEAATWPLQSIVEIKTIEPHGETAWDTLITDVEKRSLLESLDSGKPIAVRVPTTVRHREKIAARSWFDVFLQRVEGVGRTRPLIVREGITISEDKTPSVQDCVALIVVDHGPLAGLVGDAETPAHTTLQPDLVADKYVSAGKILKIIRGSAAGIISSLESSADADDFALLADFFPIVDEDEPERKRKAKGKGKEPVTPPIPPIAKVSPRYRVTQTAGGFQVSGTEEGDLPSSLTIRIAYQVRRGNPLKRYNPLDFSLQRRDLRVAIEKAAVLEKGHNTLIVAPSAPGFKIDISGFDRMRDLIVRVDATSPEGAL